jgi:hypothetical protein
MNVFWEKSRVQRWKAEIFGNEQYLQNPRDGCFNMLSLDKCAHALWGAGQFALRPMETSDSRTLKVQFHWQKRSSDGVAELGLLTEPESSRGLYGDKDYSLPVLTGTYRDNGEPLYRAIASGDVFTITTHDPEHLPLPSWSLLEMQWYLQRIAGMSGAAEVGDHLDFNNHDTDSTAPCIAAIRRTRDIYQWLRVLPENDEESDPQQPPIQVYHLMTPL